MPPLYFWIALMGGDVVFGRFKDNINETMNSKHKARWQVAIEGAGKLRLQMAGELSFFYRKYRGLELFPHIPPQHWTHCGVFKSTEPGKPPAFNKSFFETVAHQPLRELTFELLSTQLADRDHNINSAFLDPLRPLTHNHEQRPHYAVGERKLLYYLRKVLDAEFAEKELKDYQSRLAISLECYLTVRFSFHRMGVHDEGSHGLFRFKQTFAQRGGFLSGSQGTAKGRKRRRLRRYTRKLERDRMRSTLETHLGREPNGCSRSIHQEIRVSLGLGALAPLELHAWAEGALSYLNNHHSVDREVVFPLTLTIHASKRGSSEKAADAAFGMAKRLIYILEEQPGLRSWVTGFDCAGRERENPPRVFAHTYGYLQKTIASIRSGQTDAYLDLGFTYHVGEDFDDLLSALRHIDETINLLLPTRRGGRLGHGIALGEDPERFYELRAQSLEVNLKSHLLDLVWAWGKLQEAEQLNDFLWLQGFIGRTMDKAGSKKIISIGLLSLVYQKMLQLPALPEADLLDELGLSAMSPDFVYIEASTTWIKMIGALQAILCRQIKGRPITIEVNPTSNLIVCGYRDYAKLPYLAMTHAGLSLSLNTDDPGMFMTTLAGEYAVMYRTLIAKNYSHEEAMNWLEARTTAAKRSIFGRNPLPRLKLGGPDAIPRALATLFQGN